MIWVVIALLLWVALSTLSFACMWGDWYDTFGPHRYGTGSKWAFSVFDEDCARSLSVARRGFMLLAAIPLVGWAVGLAAWFMYGNGMLLRMPAEAKERRTR